MPNKFEEFINKAIQTAKYATLANHSAETLEAMIRELEAEGEALKKEVADVLR